MLNSMKLSIAVAAVSLSFMGAANAAGNHDGGLMKEMMSSKYQVQPITDAAAQSRLHAVVIPGERDGGLMAEMSKVKVVDHYTAADQSRLDDVVFRDSDS